MAIHDMWSYDHTTLLGSDISVGTTLSAYTENNTYNVQTGLPGMLYKNATGTGVIGSDGFLTLTTGSGSNPVLLVQAKEVQDWNAATKYWIGFRTKTSAQNGAACNIFSISDSLTDTNFQALLQETDMNAASANVANTEYFVEIMIDRTNLLYEVWINGVKIKNGSLTSAALPANGVGYYWWGAYNSLSGVTNGANRSFKDYYFLDVDATTTGRLGSTKSGLQNIASVTAPNYAAYTGILSGSATITTAQSRYGTAALTLGSTASSAVTIPDGSNVKCLSGDFTIECWCESTNNAQIGVLFGKDTGSAPYAHVTYNNGVWALYADQVSTTAAISATSGVAVNTEMHFAIVLHNGTWTMYQNGVALGTAAGSTFGNNTSAFLIGNYGALANQWNGYINGFRISNVARYTAPFTPQTTPFVADANTLLLMQLTSSSNGAVPDDVGSPSSVLQRAYSASSTSAPILINAPSDDTLTVGLATSYSSAKKIFAMDFRAAIKTPNSPASFTSSIQQGANSTSFGAGTLSDSSLNYGRRLGLTTVAPDGGAWTTSKINSTSLLLTPTS